MTDSHVARDSFVRAVQHICNCDMTFICVIRLNHTWHMTYAYVRILLEAESRCKGKEAKERDRGREGFAEGEERHVEAEGRINALRKRRGGEG